MFSRCATLSCYFALIACLSSAAQEKKVPDKKAPGTWISPDDPTLPIDFKIQGEYAGMTPAGALGCQVIALGKGTFQAVLLPGGLIGAGWDGNTKILLAGALDGQRAVFTPAAGKRKYLAKLPAEFSAAAKFPPPGQKEYTAVIMDEKLIGKADTGATFELHKTWRQSPTLGQPPPAGAVVLFDGTSTAEWQGGRLDAKTGWLHTDNKDIATKRKFRNFGGHVEFFSPFRPEARGQGRGNSGVYLANLYEVQILDSFGLEGKNNECGGIYGRLAPKLNACLPPLTWQTYDLEFTSAVLDEAGKKTKNARITLRHNGFMVHDNVEVPGPTGGARGVPEGIADVIRLQGHGNPLQFRNVWVVER